MDTHFKNHVLILIVAVFAALTLNAAFADDITPAPYRGDPLSVYAHWQQIPGTPFLDLDPSNPAEFNYWDDSDPSTYLSPDWPLSDYIEPDTNKSYEFSLPNFVDDLPLKKMRIQVTWQFVLDPPPLIVGLSGVDPTGPVDVSHIFSSPVETLPTGYYYQYHDYELKPNPDAERWVIAMQPNAELVQVVADTVSTVPEPATLLTLGLGGWVLFKRRK